MPKDPDIRRVLIVGSGPIVIGQACEFDYSGTQACRALRGEGIEVVLLNSNPATIMTDADMADATYIEPITPAIMGKIFHYQMTIGKPIDAVLPTLGGQTGLNCAVEAAERGILRAHGVRLIGADVDVINRAENRTRFKETAQAIGLDVPRSGVVHDEKEARAVLEQVGLPCVLRPAFTLGGTGGGIATSQDEYARLIEVGLRASRIREVLVEESLIGWKEFELEVMRDRNDNVIIVCSIENLDPMGVHTGDSVTVAPAQTLSDREYQQMRDSAIALMRAVGVETGGSNIQFAVCPRSGRQVVIEMNPRVSRSSALASKATGFPIAKIAAKLAIGYTLDEIPNDITGKTLACFEPSIDYVVVKMPRWTFEKFPDADETLTTQMKSVGEAMAIGRTFKEAFQKCIRSMEIKRSGFGLDDNDLWLKHVKCCNGRSRGSTSGSGVSGTTDTVEEQSVFFGNVLGEAPPDTEETSASGWPVPPEILRDKLSTPCQGRLYYVRYALKQGWPLENVRELTAIDPWFLAQLAELVAFETEILSVGEDGLSPVWLRRARLLGYSSEQLSRILDSPPERVLKASEATAPGGYRLVDTCAGEFPARTPYCYHAHDPPVRRWNGDTLIEEFVDELRLNDGPHVVVLGGGPNRIGQGIEFDYCCVQAAAAAREAGYRTVMINSNPETVSTDYDTSDVLFFEPLTFEDTLRVIRTVEKKARLAGVIVQFGGQTPLNLADDLQAAGTPIIGTPSQSIHLAEDRGCFQRILGELSLRCPAHGVAHNLEEARDVAAHIGYPVLLRPSYVLGGRGMQKCNHEQDLIQYVQHSLDATDRNRHGWRHPLLIDHFLMDAFEVDVDAVADFRRPDDPNGTCLVCGVMEHIEEAGIHSGDSSCVLPPYSLSPAMIEEIERQTRLLAGRLAVCGMMNVQFAIENDIVYVLEANPRASRTLPFVSKATGVSWAKIGTRVMLGESLRDAMAAYGVDGPVIPTHTSVKTPVFPFDRFEGVDVVLGPEMRSTGEVMGIDRTYGMAFAKAQMAVGLTLPTGGNALVSVNDPDKPRVVPIARELHELGFDLFATIGTHQVLADAGIPSVVVSKYRDATGPFLLEMILDGSLDLLINTPIYTGRASDEGRWRTAAFAKKIPLITTLSGARAAVAAIRAMRQGRWGVRPLQEYFAAGAAR